MFPFVVISSSQLPKSIIFQRGRLKPPTSYWYLMSSHDLPWLWDNPSFPKGERRDLERLHRWRLDLCGLRPHGSRLSGRGAPAGATIDPTISATPSYKLIYQRVWRSI
jgi:hypothetical protein